jgi:hypothetical protein
MGVGAFNILAGIITTIYQFLKISELNEGHRVAALYWGKFYRNLRTELAKHPLDRTNHDLVLTGAKEEYDRLLEMSPMVPQSIIKEFNRKYGIMSGFTRPEIVTTRFGTDIFNMSDIDRKAMVEELLTDKIAVEKARDAELAKAKDSEQLHTEQLVMLTDALTKAEHDRELANNEIATLRALFENRPATPEPEPVVLKKEPELESPDLAKFKETFIGINGRYPTEQEIKAMFTAMYSPDASPTRESLVIDLKDLDLDLPEVSNV